MSQERKKRAASICRIVFDYSQTRTDAEGKYKLTTSQPGDYVAWATKEGFGGSARTLELRSGGKQAVTFYLPDRQK